MERLKLTSLDASRQRIISLPKALADREKLVASQIYQVKFGVLQTPATLELNPKNELEIRVSPDVMSALRLIRGTRYSLKVDLRHGIIAFGPVVGVFVSPHFIASFGNGHPPKSAEGHGKAAWDAHAFLYYFSHKHIDWLNHTTLAWVFKGKGRWSRKRVPLPDVLYDRATHFKDREKPRVKQARAHFNRIAGLRLINSRHYLDKWYLHQRLAKYPQIQPYLPETVQYRGIADVASLLKRYPRVFLKSFYGSRAAEVFMIEASGDGVYTCRTARKKMAAKSLEEVQSLVEKFFVTDQIVVQQGINLLKHQGSNMDMRVLLHKNGAGEWRVTFILVRVAPGDSPITNICHHGKPMSFMGVMPMILGCNKAALYLEREIARVSVLIARHIEQEYGPFGEIGLDMALDQGGRIWMLEANGKPDKIPLPVEQEMISGLAPEFTRIFEYSKFLSGFFPVSYQIG